MGNDDCEAAGQHFWSEAGGGSYQCTYCGERRYPKRVRQPAPQKRGPVRQQQPEPNPFLEELNNERVAEGLAPLPPDADDAYVGAILLQNVLDALVDVRDALKQPKPKRKPTPRSKRPAKARQPKATPPEGRRWAEEAEERVRRTP